MDPRANRMRKENSTGQVGEAILGKRGGLSAEEQKEEEKENARVGRSDGGISSKGSEIDRNDD